ncbi:hypothetical protein RhiJN_10771 [Ceratobasidium sp. AG-Ba]|nr:hypothetical protein RhiJN_10771 [Ceratobasidium sp. AG-Ba]
MFYYGIIYAVIAAAVGALIPDELFCVLCVTLGNLTIETTGLQAGGTVRATALGCIGVVFWRVSVRGRCILYMALGALWAVIARMIRQLSIHLVTQPELNPSFAQGLYEFNQVAAFAIIYVSFFVLPAHTSVWSCTLWWILRTALSCWPVRAMALPLCFAPPMRFSFPAPVWIIFNRLVGHGFLEWILEMDGLDDEDVPNALNEVSGGLIVRDKRLEILLIPKARVSERVDEVPLVHIMGVSQVHHTVLMYSETPLEADIEVRPQLMIEWHPLPTESPTMVVPPIQPPISATPIAFDELTAACLQQEVAPGSTNEPNWLFQEIQAGTRARRLFLNDLGATSALILVALFLEAQVQARGRFLSLHAALSVVVPHTFGHLTIEDPTWKLISAAVETGKDSETKGSESDERNTEESQSEGLDIENLNVMPVAFKQPAPNTDVSEASAIGSIGCCNGRNRRAVSGYSQPYCRNSHRSRRAQPAGGRFNPAHSIPSLPSDVPAAELVDGSLDRDLAPVVSASGGEFDPHEPEVPLAELRQVEAVPALLSAKVQCFSPAPFLLPSRPMARYMADGASRLLSSLYRTLPPPIVQAPASWTTRRSAFALVPAIPKVDNVSSSEYFKKFSPIPAAWLRVAA